MSISDNITTLFQLSVDSFVEHFVMRCFSQNIGESGFERLLREVPTIVIDIIVSKVLKAFVKQFKLSSEDIMSVPYLLDNISSPYLTSLNLKPLISLGNVQGGVLLHFENRLLATLPIFSNLIKLSLTTHTKTFTLPMCSNRILVEIGLNCHKLQSLDISHNQSITDYGLKYLIPSSGAKGCPLLEELFFYNCNVSTACICDILEYLPMMRIIGYKETGAVLLRLHDKFKDQKKVLNLTHLDHSGRTSRTCRNIHKMHFTVKLMHATQDLCPNLQNLKIRATDHDVGKLEAFPSLQSLDIIFNTGKPSAPGNGMTRYLQQYGSQLSCLELVCNSFHERLFPVIGYSCPHLKHIWIRCNEISLNKELTTFISDKTVYTQLETFYLRIGESEFSKCILPVGILSYVLGNTSKLNDLRLLMRCKLVTDEWLSELWHCITTDKLEKLMIVLPAQNFQEGAIKLSISSVHMILDSCPNLKKLGNILVWNVSRKEYEELQAELKSDNYDLDISFRIMAVK